jgi:hypothetical protein
MLSKQKSKQYHPTPHWVCSSCCFTRVRPLSPRRHPALMDVLAQLLGGSEERQETMGEFITRASANVARDLAVQGPAWGGALRARGSAWGMAWPARGPRWAGA